jgi:hypothetical protein
MSSRERKLGGAGEAAPSIQAAKPAAEKKKKKKSEKGIDLRETAAAGD